MMTAKKDEQEDKVMPTLRLQSKYHNHTVSIRPTRRVIHAGLGIIEPVPGVFAQFEGPQRIFDSAAAQKKWGWDDATRDEVERKLVTIEGFMNDYYPAPLSQVPDHLLEIARVKPSMKRLICQAFAIDDGNLIQCDKSATAGRQYCEDHDPDVTRIKHGSGTTVG